MQLQHALGLYLVQLEADGRSHHTIAQAGRHIRVLARWRESQGLHDDVKEIDHQEIAKFLISDDARLRPDGKTKKATTTNTLRSSLRAFFAYLHLGGLIASNPARLVRRARCDDPLPKALSEDEQRRLMRALAEGRGRAAERDHALFALMLGTGIRLGAALNLRVGDVDVERGELMVRHGKGGRVRTVFLGPAVRDHLAGFLKGRVSGPVFTGYHGEALSPRHVQRRLGLWLQRAGCRPASPHALRHSFGQGLYERTGDVLLVQAALGHRSITSTLIYAHAGIEEVRRAMVGL